MTPPRAGPCPPFAGAPVAWRPAAADAAIGRAWPVAATVLAFVLWWPLGLLALFLWKGSIAMGCFSRRRRSRDDRPFALAPRGGSGNTAFDEHRAAVLRRLEEERRALDAQQREFAEFLVRLERARDQEEFDRFMAGRAAGARPETV